MNDVLDEVFAGLGEKTPDPLPEINTLLTPWTKHLLRQLVMKMPRNECYVEAGIFHAGGIISTLLDQKDVKGYGMDIWQDIYGPDARSECFKNIERYKPRLPGDMEILEEDCFAAIQRRAFDRPIGVLFYDADHSQESQRRAMSEFFPLLADRAIVVVDDMNIPSVRRGTWLGISDWNVKWMKHWFLPGTYGDKWHNCAAVFYLEKGPDCVNHV